MEQRPPLHLSVVVIEKGAFGLPLSKVTNFIFYLYISIDIVYKYICMYVCMYVWSY